MAPCWSSSHSPGPQSFRPVLSTNKGKGLLSLRGLGRGTSSVSARRQRVGWSGIARVSPSRPMTEPRRPSVWRRARWNTALSASAVSIAQGQTPGLPARSRARLRLPALYGFVREPDHQAATLAQAGVTRAPAAEQRSQRVHDLVRLLGTVLAEVLVQLES